MAHPVNDHALDVIFRDARSQNGFTDKSVPEVLVRAVYDLAKMGPTSANCSPARFVWVTTEEGKQRLAPHMSEGNRDKTLAASRIRSPPCSRTPLAPRTGSMPIATRQPFATVRCKVPTS